MSIDFTAKLLDLNGREILGLTIKDGAQAVLPATLGSIAVDSLANAPAEVGLTMADKLRAFKLAKSIPEMPQATLSAESIALIKRCIAAVQSPVVVGRCFEILDPAGMTAAD